ncbi:recombinase family protein [Coprococcus comes]|nr:recombinase family protein [Coprococcus comes]
MAMMNEMEYRTIGSALAGGYRAAVYCRLSKDDDLQGESASIANQRDMLEKYCEKQGWEVVAVYQDDGFTGLNMERPDLQRMLRAIERRQINLVITKDLSRLGRNYLQTGHLIEDFFPRNGVRYIAMNDGIDTLRDNNDIAPFKNILNEMYSKDISKNERRQINLVITKDLSRLGRNYLQTGHLIEDFFPRNGVRYIAMNDGIDTLRDNNDIAPFKNILNEMYSKDISKKVHSSYLLKAQKGQFTGCLAPFGYRKDPEDKNHLLIDEETAPIVRLIFGYALNGHGPNYIRRRLEEEKIPCPTWWNRERGLRNTRTKWEKKDPENGRYMWDFSVIKDLLMNPVYTGAIASQKKDYRFKIGTIGEKKPEDWIVVEGQHEPLIDRMSFDIVQNKLKSRQRPGQTDEISLFAGLLKCGECGKSLTVRYTNAKHPQRIYSCKTYNAFGKNHCTQHRIDYDTLYSHVLRKIRECARAALMDGEAVADRLTNTCEAEQREQREAMERSLTRDEERIEVLDKMVMRLYEDMIAGRISEQNFNTMLEKTQTEQTELKAKVSEGRKRLSDEVQLANDAKQWVEAIQEYANITELDAATLNRLIKEIVVHERIDEDKTRHISIEIHFNLKPIPEVEQVTA